MAMTEGLPVTRLLPNMLTLLSLCSGLTAIQMSLQDEWSNAVIAIVISAVFDVLDGRVARMLNIASKFGAELDSLSDCVSFGVAPGFVLYLWTLRNGGSFGWAAVLIFAVCMALRLARFNTMLETHDLPVWTKSFFTGVPAPAGAGLALLPINLVLAFGDNFRMPVTLVALWVMFCGGLLVSRVPTFAVKGRRVAPAWVVPIMLGTGFAIAMLITNPWISLCAMTGLYLLSLPCSWYSYNRRLRAEEQ